MECGEHIGKIVLWVARLSGRASPLGRVSCRRSISALPATARAAPAYVNRSGRKPSKTIDTTSARNGVMTPIDAGGPRPDAFLQRQEASNVSTEPASAR